MKTIYKTLLKTAGAGVALQVLLCCCGTGLHAQLPFVAGSLMAAQGEKQNSIYCIREFTAVPYENYVFINLTMKGESAESVILLEKSVNGSEFIVIDKKDGYPAPTPDAEIIYSFKDPAPGNGKTAYRIKQFRLDGVLYSKIASVDIAGEPPVVER